MRLALAVGVLALVSIAHAESIKKEFTASVSFDENGRSVDTSTEAWHQFGPRSYEKKEPAVVWCEPVIHDHGNNTFTFPREICGREDGSVFWRQK